MANLITCPHCRRMLQIPAIFDGAEVRCPICAREFVGRVPTNVTATPPAEVERPADAGAEIWPTRRSRRVRDDDLSLSPALDRPFRPAGGLGIAVITLLALNLLLSFAMLGSDYLQYNLAVRMVEGVQVLDAEINRNDTRQMVLGLVHFAIYIATAIVFVIWFHRAYANLVALGTPYLTYGTGWAVGSWFVPILNLFRPVQIAQEIWRCSDPHAVARGDYERSGNSTLIGFWWALWIISSLIGNLSARLGWAVNSPQTLLTATALGMVAEVTAILAAMLAMAVVIKINDRQSARAEALHRQGEW